MPVPAARVAPAPRAPDVVPERRGVVSILSNVGRRGEWAVPRLFRALSLLGNVELDLTRARIGAGTSELEILCVLGCVTVHVPPGVRVECAAGPVIGSVEMRGEPVDAAPDAPVVRITGTAFMGAIDVVVVDPATDERPDHFRPRLPAGTRRR